jgi:hypothetical protein
MSVDVQPYGQRGRVHLVRERRLMLVADRSSIALFAAGVQSCQGSRADVRSCRRPEAMSWRMSPVTGYHPNVEGEFVRRFA